MSGVLIYLVAMSLLLKTSVFFTTMLVAVGLSTPLRAATVYSAQLLASNEVPPVASAATGFATLTLNGNNLSVSESFANLSAPANAGHIHCCAPVGTNANVAVPFTNFPALVSATYNMSFDLTLLATYNSAFVTANGGTVASAEAALIAGLNSGTAYVNIHDANNPSGEIRGLLVAVPEPAALLLSGLGCALLLLFAIKRRLATL